MVKGVNLPLSALAAAWCMRAFTEGGICAKAAGRGAGAGFTDAR